MFRNRISEFHFHHAATPVQTEFESAFIACPLQLFGAFNATQQAFVAEVYRRAREQAEAQLRYPVRRRLVPEFSRN